MPWSDQAARQLGLVTTGELDRAGVTRRQRRGLLADATLIPVHRGVYRVSGAPVTMQQRRLAAVIAVGQGALSHLAAASVWGAGHLDDAPPELVVPLPCSVRLPGVVMHRARDLRGGDVMAHRPFPRITRPAITLLHIAELDSVDDARLEEIGADLLLGWPNERRRLRESLVRLARRGRRGPARVDALFGEYLTDDRRPPHPGLERNLLSVLRASTLPDPVVHMKLETPLGVLEVDFAWPDAKLVVEADSARWHSSPTHLRTDRARDQAIATVGWLTLRVTWDQVMHDPSATVERIATVRAARLDQLKTA